MSFETIKAFFRLFIPRILDPGYWNFIYKNKYLEFYYGYIKKEKVDETIDVNWKHIHVNRTALINALILEYKLKNTDCKYLEIGCGSNVNFNSIPLPLDSKTGVDPDTERNGEGGNIVVKTSDEFFKTNESKFDIIFIDGLHEYEQCQRDAINSLKYLNEGGTILFHDFLPINWKVEHMPRISGGWTGDVWKVGAELHESKGLDFKIIFCDAGVGFLRKKDNSYEYKKMNTELKDNKYDSFLIWYKKFNIINAYQLLDTINNLKK